MAGIFIEKYKTLDRMNEHKAGSDRQGMYRGTQRSVGGEQI